MNTQAQTALTNEQLTKRLARAETAIARLEQIVVRRSLTSAEMEYFAKKFPELVQGAVANTVAQAATISVPAAPKAQPATKPAESRMVNTDEIVSGLYFNPTTGDAVLVTKDGTMFSLDGDTRVPIANVSLDGFEWKAKNGLAPVISKMVRELKATVSQPARAVKPTAPKAPAKATQAAQAVASTKKVKLADMDGAQMRDLVLEYKGDAAKITNGYKKHQFDDVIRFWLYTFQKAARTNGGNATKARQAAYAALAD
jgi:hypothetical protein